MTASGSYDVREMHRDANSEIQRLGAQARLGWEKESRNLSRFGVKDGMSLLELGSGPGFITESLLTLLPGSSITCLEIDPALLEQAQQYLQDKANHRLRQAQSASGGNRRVGRNLWRIRKAVGFCNLELEVVAFHSDSIGIEPFLPQIDPDRLLPLVKVGLISEQELEKIRVSCNKFLNSPEPFILMLSLMICGEKPH